MGFGSITLNDGNKVPAIAFGTGSKWKRHDVTKYVEQAIELGYSHIDTAQFYETEEYVGVAIRESGLARDELFITTKYSVATTSPRKALTNSLSKLGLKSVDLYLIHQPSILSVHPEAWAEFESFKKEGLVKSIGVSNFNLKQLKALVKKANIIPTVNQIMLSPYTYHEHKDLLAFAKERKIVTEAYSSLSPITRYPGGPVDKPINAAADRLKATPTQVILAWVISKGAVIVTTSSTKEHLNEYLDVASLPALTEEEIVAIDAAGASGPPSNLCLRLKKSWNWAKFTVLFVLWFTLLLYRYGVLWRVSM